jgi:hypothetical protein
MPGSRASATLVQELAAVNVKTFALWTVKPKTCITAGLLPGPSGNLAALLLAWKILRGDFNHLKLGGLKLINR